MKHIRVITLLATVIVVLGAVAQAEETVSEVIDKLQAQYDLTTDFSATFTQVTTAKNLLGPAGINGKLYIKKPGMMRWVYTNPMKREIISDGQTLWLYYPDEKEVRVYKAAEAFENLPFLNFLFGKEKIKDDFTAAFGDLESDKAKDYYLIVLTPKAADSSIAKVLALVSNKDSMIKQLNMFDLVGNETTLAFEDIAINSGLKDSQFHFIVPSGVEIIPVGNTPALPKPEVKIKIEE